MDTCFLKALEEELSIAFQIGFESANDEEMRASFHFAENVLTDLVLKGTLDNSSTKISRNGYSLFLLWKYLLAEHYRSHPFCFQSQSLLVKMLKSYPERFKKPSRQLRSSSISIQRLRRHQRHFLNSRNCDMKRRIGTKKWNKKKFDNTNFSTKVKSIPLILEYLHEPITVSSFVRNRATLHPGELRTKPSRR